MDWKIAGLALLALSGCGAAGDGRFVGTMATEQGACGLGFDGQGKAAATLMLRGESAQFAPSDGVVVLNGHVNGAGHVVAGSNAPGADKKPFLEVFEGDRDGDKVVGKFATPRCRAAVVLSKR